MSAEPEAATGDDGADGLGAPGEAPEWLSLDEGEEVQWVGQPSTSSLIPAFVWGVVLLPVFGIGLLVIAASLVTVRNTDFVVTNTTLYHKSGVLSTNIESVGLDRIQNTEYSQSFFGGQLGYGTIEISTAGSGGADLSFRSIENPQDVRDLVNRLGNTVGDTAGAGTAGGAAGAGGARGAGAGVEAELLEELLTELRGVNESMADIERMLREERSDPVSDTHNAQGGVPGGTGGRAAGDRGGAGSDATAGGSGTPAGDRGGAGSDTPASDPDAGGGTTAGDETRTTASEFVSSSSTSSGDDAPEGGEKPAPVDPGEDPDGAGDEEEDDSPSNLFELDDEEG